MKISLKAARVNANLTQSDVSKIIGLSKDTVKHIENGKRELKVCELDVLCKIYNCTRDDIFLPINSPKSE